MIVRTNCHCTISVYIEGKGDTLYNGEREKEKEKVGIEAVGEGATRGTFSRPDPLGRSKQMVLDRIPSYRSGSVRSSLVYSEILLLIVHF